MLKAQIKVGSYYIARVNGNLVTVRVDAIREYNPSFFVDSYRTLPSHTRYDVVNLKTGRKTTFRSAQKFRREVPCPTPASAS